MRALAGIRQERVAGSDLPYRLAEEAARRGLTVAFVGGQPGAAASTAERLTAASPSLQVVLTHEAPPGMTEDPASLEAFLSELRAARPDLLFLAMGAPRQERFATSHDLAAGVVICVGAALDFVSGQRKRAPRAWQVLRLEWLHRIIQEPRRLGPRYLDAGPRFAWIVARQKWSNLARGAPLFVSWIKEHGRSRDLASALGIDAEFIAVGRLRHKPSAPFRYAAQAALTLVALVRRRPRALVVMAPPLPLALLALAYAAATGAALILDAHTGAVVDEVSGRRLKRSFVRVAQRARLTVVTNEPLAALLRAEGVATLVVHDLLASSDGPARRPDAPPPRPLVVMPAAWAADEPMHVVVEAARALPECDVVITGHPGAQWATMQPPPNLRTSGHLPLAQYDALLRSADVVLALTTAANTMQRAGYEALIRCVPLVASESEVLRQYFEDAIVSTALEPDAVSTAIREALRNGDELRHKMSELVERRRTEEARGIAALRAALER
jgi:exopolysaccharide biosynthesis WecB/TagA/CpsF family protein